MDDLEADGMNGLVGGDVNSMIDYFMRKQQEDSHFFFTIEPDEDNVVKNIFWVDGRLRRAYQEFGDVVTFDTTYNTNKYNMPMGPFLGVNHHRQPIFFGCALIRDKKKATFVWLFKTWLEAMGGKKPQTIITDQDPAIRVAIETVFGSDTVHRCCLRHVMRKARDNLGVLYTSVKGFKDELVDVINLSLTIADFETNWCAMLKKYRMENNSYLNLMFEKRNEWAPVYFRETFCAGLSSTQRNKRMNVLTKIWMDPNTSLYDFATKFEKMVECVYERESDEDFRSMNEIPPLWSYHPIEIETRQVYTRNVYSLFKAKFKRCTAYQVHEVEKEKLYEVRPAIIQSKYDWHKPTHMVLIDKINGRVDCECKGFLFQGLLCFHALQVMQRVGMMPLLPPHYILKRWTRDANANIKRDISENNLKDRQEKELQSVMLHALTQRMQRVAKEAAKSRAAYDKARIEMVELEEVVTEINKGIDQRVALPVHECDVGNAVSAPSVARKSLKFGDPSVSQCKGKRKPQILNPLAEVKDTKKMRTCSYCHRKEGHNTATCPKRMKDGITTEGRARAFNADESESDGYDDSEDGTEDDIKDDDFE